MPHFRDQCSHSAAYLYVPTFGQFFFAISYRELPFPRADELPAILVLSRVIVANPPLFCATLIRTLIADANPPLSASLRPPRRGHVSVPECDPLLCAVSQLSRRNGPFSATDALPRISTKFRTISGSLPQFAEGLFGTLIAAANSPFSRPF